MKLDNFQLLNSRRTVIFVMVAVFLFLQYELWLSQGGIKSILSLHKNIQTQTQTVNTLAKQNNVLTADIIDLKQGGQASEERARTDLGMIKPDETYYQFLG